MEQRKDTKWGKIRKDLNEVGKILGQLSNAALMIDADLRSMRKELTEKGLLEPITQPNDPEKVLEEKMEEINERQEAKTEDYFPAKEGIGEADQAKISN